MKSGIAASRCSSRPLRSRRACSRRYAVSGPRPDNARRAGELRRDRRRRGALGGHVHRARQGADPSALRQLPSGRRPPAPGRRGPAAPAAGRARRGRSWRCEPCAARSATRRPTSIPAACPATPEWHLAPREMAWEGKTLGEICAQIKDPARNGGRKSLEDLDPSHRHRHAGRLGLGARVRPHARSRHAEGGRRAGRGLGQDRSRVPEQMTPPRRSLRGLQVSGLATCFWKAGRCFRRSW